MKENQIRELVNELRDIAIEYHGTQQLRERIARTVRAAIIQAGNSPVIPDERIAFNEWNNGEDCLLAGRDAKSAAWLAWIHRAKLGVTPAPVQVDIEMLASALKNAPLAPSDNQGRPRAPVVPPAIEPDYKVIKSILPTANPDEYACCIAADMWNACRAAMLQGVEQPQNARQNIPENIPDGNSPAIPDDWVMVPKEPTQAMIKAWLSEVANWRGHVAGYKAALAAAPQHEVK
ncbi:hypothetical protein [Salmonella enterica]|uniref:hypothetical protein n=1 Tax=Salmonella enterica TaxID=28901 RepID=UPI001EE89E20|nr:hypothetical protein [Salmonella enterica]